MKSWEWKTIEHESMRKQEMSMAESKISSKRNTINCLRTEQVNVHIPHKHMRYVYVNVLCTVKKNQRVKLLNLAHRHWFFCLLLLLLPALLRFFIVSMKNREIKWEFKCFAFSFFNLKWNIEINNREKNGLRTLMGRGWANWYWKRNKKRKIIKMELVNGN